MQNVLGQYFPKMKNLFVLFFPKTQNVLGHFFPKKQNVLDQWTLRHGLDGEGLEYLLKFAKKKQPRKKKEGKKYFFCAMFLFFIYLKCMKILDNAQSIYRGSEYGLTEALPPPPCKF